MVGYIMRKNKWTYDEALKFVQSKRDIVMPNPGFAAQLKKYQENHAK